MSHSFVPFGRALNPRRMVWRALQEVQVEGWISAGLTTVDPVADIDTATIEPAGQPPESPQEEMLTGRGTAIGEGIAMALDAIAEAGQSTSAEPMAEDNATVTPATEDEYEPDITVLHTDGNYNAGSVTQVCDSPVSRASKLHLSL